MILKLPIYFTTYLQPHLLPLLSAPSLLECKPEAGTYSYCYHSFTLRVCAWLIDMGFQDKCQSTAPSNINTESEKNELHTISAFLIFEENTINSCRTSGWYLIGVSAHLGAGRWVRQNPSLCFKPNLLHNDSCVSHHTRLPPTSFLIPIHLTLKIIICFLNPYEPSYSFAAGITSTSLPNRGTDGLAPGLESQC